jgi:hypothetical protein
MFEQSSQEFGWILWTVLWCAEFIKEELSKQLKIFDKLWVLTVLTT